MEVEPSGRQAEGGARNPAIDPLSLSKIKIRIQPLEIK
jgi:hypothetical protein